MNRPSKFINMELKVCMLGNSGVGKSSIIQRFVHDTFDASNPSTIGASFMSKTIMFSGSSIKLNIWDTAGQDTFKVLTPMYYRGANICIVVYDITDRNSFDAVQNWIKELRTYITDQKCLIAMAGNKCDLSGNGRRVISAKEAKDYADSVGAFVVETSAQTGLNVNELFITNVSKLYKQLNQQNSSSSSNLITNKTNGNEAIRLNERRATPKSGNSCC